MVFFITFLRAFATCLITNAHYTGVYPTDLIANGGLIGDIIFFAVSGYCLYNVKGNFIHWYSKRIVRCYLPVILITMVYMLLGFYSLSKHSVIWWFIYPTNYHFIASITLLYIPFYFIMKSVTLKRNIPHVMLILLVICITVYISPLYDKSFYHIDSVKEPMIRFLFLESMLLGAYFKHTEDHIERKFKLRYIFGTAVCITVYYLSKVLFSNVSTLSYLQILNWFAIFTLLYFIFILFASIENLYKKLPKYIIKTITYLATITLEIYLVQYVIIDIFRSLIKFPLNWFVITTLILLSATILNILCKYILNFFASLHMRKYK